MPWSCDPAQSEMTKSLLPQSPPTPQQLAGKDGFLAESHTWPPYAVPPSSPSCPPLWPNHSHKSLPQCRRHSWVPSKGFSLFPRHQSEAVRTFAIWTCQAIGFFGDRYACRDQRTCNQIIQSVVSGCSPWSFLANKAMDPSGTDQWPTLLMVAKTPTVAKIPTLTLRLCSSCKFDT